MRNHGYGRRTALRHFMQGTWASLVFGIVGVLEPIPRGYWGKREDCTEEAGSSGFPGEERRAGGPGVKETYFSWMLFRTVWIFHHVCVTFPIKTANQKISVETERCWWYIKWKKQATKKNVEDSPTSFVYICIEKRQIWDNVSVILNGQITVFFIFSFFADQYCLQWPSSNYITWEENNILESCCLKYVLES